MRQAFITNLAHTQKLLLNLGAAAEDAIRQAIASLAAQNLVDAKAIIANDDQLDLMEQELEENVIKLLALQQPLAKDLRTLSAIWNTAADLERIGDYAENIAERTLWIGKTPLIKPLNDILSMAHMAQNMLQESLDAFSRRDVELAKKVCLDDDPVDLLYATLFDELMHSVASSNVAQATQAVQLLFIARYLERVADHATNIAERVIYMVTGERVSHQLKSQA